MLGRPSQRAVTAVLGALVLVAVVVAALVSASEDSSLGRLRAGIGDAAGSVGEAITVPSEEPAPSAAPTPTATPVPEGAAESRAALARAGALLGQVEAGLAAERTALTAGDARAAATHRAAAVERFNSLRDVIASDVIVPGAEYDAVYDRAQELQAELTAR